MSPPADRQIAPVAPSRQLPILPDSTLTLRPVRLPMCVHVRGLVCETHNKRYLIDSLAEFRANLQAKYPYAIIEGSGGVTIETLAEFLGPYVDVISMGNLTQACIVGCCLTLYNASS